MLAFVAKHDPEAAQRHARAGYQASEASINTGGGAKGDAAGAHEAAVKTGEWDEAAHPRDADGKFT